MAKNIEFMGAVFPDVPSIRLPQHEGGLVSFDDTTDANATAEDIAQGKTAYVNGEKLFGTASGGGSSWELIATREYTFAEQPSTTKTKIDTLSLNADDVYRKDRIIFGVARKRNPSSASNTHIGTDSYFLNPNSRSSAAPALTGSVNRALWNYFRNNSGDFSVNVSGLNTSGGVYIDTISAPDGAGKCLAEVYVRYLSYWGSLIGTYDFYVYALSWPDGLEPYK